MPLVIEKSLRRQAAYMKESPDFYYNKKDSSQVKDERSEKEKLVRLWEDQIKMKKLTKKRVTAEGFAHDLGGVQMAHSMTMAALRANLMVEGSYPEDLPIVVAVDSAELERKTMSKTESLAEDAFRNYMDGMWSWFKEIIEDQGLSLSQKMDKIFHEIERSKDYNESSSPEGVGEMIVVQTQGFPPNILEEYLSQFEGQQIIDELKKLVGGAEIPSQLIQQGMGEYRSKSPITQNWLIEVYLVQAIKPDASIETHWNEGEDLTQEQLDELEYHIDYEGNLVDELGRKILGHDMVFYGGWAEPKSIWKNPQARPVIEDVSYFGTTLDAFQRAFPGLKVDDPRSRDLPLLNEPDLRIGRRKDDRAWAIFRPNMGRGDDYVIAGGMNGDIFVPYIFPTQETAEDQLRKGIGWNVYEYGSKILPVVFNGMYWEEDIVEGLPDDLPLLNDPNLRLGRVASGNYIIKLFEEQAGDWQWYSGEDLQGRPMSSPEMGDAVEYSTYEEAAADYDRMVPHPLDENRHIWLFENGETSRASGWAVKRMDAGEYYVNAGIDILMATDAQYDGDLVFRDTPSWGVFYDRHAADDIRDRLRGIFQGINFEVVDVHLNTNNDWQEEGVSGGGGNITPDLPLLNEPDLRLGQAEEEQEWAVKGVASGLYVGVDPEEEDTYWTTGEISNCGDPPSMFLFYTKFDAEELAAKLRISHPVRGVDLGDRESFKVVPVKFNAKTDGWEEIESEPPAGPDLPLLNDPNLRFGQTAPNTQFRNQDVQVDSGGPQPHNEDRNPYGYEGRGPTSDRYFKEKGSGNTKDGQPSEQLEEDFETLWLRARTRIYLPKGIIPENAMVKVLKNKQTNEYVVESVSDSQGISKEDIKGLKLPPEMVESGKFFEIPAEGNVVAPATDYPFTVSTEVKDSPDRELDQSFWGLNRFQREP